MNETEIETIPFWKKFWPYLLILILILAVAVFFAVKIWNKNKDNDDQNVAFQNNSGITDQTILDGKELSHNICQGKEKTKLSTLPMNYDDFSMILPYGLVIDGHVTPIDHQYFSPTVFNSPRDAYPVYAMADAHLVSAEPRINEKGTEYRLIFSISCKLFYYYDLVTSLTPDVMNAVNASKGSTGGLNLEVKAGQMIGRIGGQTLDFAVWDMDSHLTGFVVPKHYEVESWKIHTVDPLLYYTDGLKTQVLGKYIRTAPPRSGKIDYDIDGKLIGNWFAEGTNGYAGVVRSNYAVGHLSIAPDYLDPTSIVVSIGDYDGEAKQFGVKGNAPDPADVGVASGLIKYELVQQDWATAGGSHWDRMSLVPDGIKAKNQTTVLGVALLQMTESRKLKFEVFPEKTATQVSNFSNNAKIYER